MRALIGAALVAAASPAAPPTQGKCAMAGARYVPRTASGQGEAAYRLLVEALPRSDEAAAAATMWRFQTLSARGQVLGEMRMLYACPGGSALCTVSRRGGASYSDVVGLTRDLAPATGREAPYALVLPGFAGANWTFTRADKASGDFRFATAEQETPDLSARLVWVRSACGRG